MELGDHLQGLMLVGGIGILCWIMMRGRMKSKAKPELASGLPSFKHNANARIRQEAFSGRASAGAPPEVLQWQVELYDLARQLKAELDCKILAVNKVTADCNRAAERLNELIIQARSVSHEPLQTNRLAHRLSEAGCTAEQISVALAVSEEQVHQWIKIESM